MCETSRHYAIQGQIENDKRFLLSDVHSTIRSSVCKTLCCVADFLFFLLCCYLKFDRICTIRKRSPASSYPNVSNRFIAGLAPQIRSLDVDLDRFTRERFGQHYVSEEFYTGISDLSYTSISNSEEISAALSKSMPFYGTLYDIAISDIETISMPCINIGPWGKDFHKLTERVLKRDLCERTPAIIQHAIGLVLADGDRQ